MARKLHQITSVQYAALALAVLGPLVMFGYILTLDMIFTPAVHLSFSLDNLLPMHLLVDLLNFILPGWLIEKLILLAIFALAGLGMHRLVPTKSEWAKYAAGIFYVINPFTYSRLMTGQYLVLAGYALMPWFIKSLFTFLREPGKGTALRLAAWTAGIGFVSIHYLGFALLVGIIALIVAAIGHRQDTTHLKKIVGWGAAAAALVLIVNSFWLVPSITGHSSQADLIGGFDERHALSFRTDGDQTVGQLINTLGLYGMWTDREGLYRLPKDTSPLWLGLLAVVWAVAIVGVIKYRHKYKFEITVLAVVALITWILAQGIIGSPFAWFNQWLFDHVPFYRGYREPGKFIGLIALALAVGFGLGVNWIIERSKDKRLGEFLPPFLVALPLLYTPTMLWGAGGQLKAVDYPADWYALNRTLDADPQAKKVLFLPWHQYMYFNFAGRLIANPASRFFDRPTIQGDNAEIGLIERQSSNATSDRIEKQILAPDRHDVAGQLRSLGITHVVLAKEADYKEYGWLDTQPGLKVQSDTATLKVYEVSK